MYSWPQSHNPWRSRYKKAQDHEGSVQSASIILATGKQTFEQSSSLLLTMAPFITSDQSNMGNPKGGIPWYLDTLERVPPLAQRVLQDYAGLKEDEVEAHIMKIVYDIVTKAELD